MTAGYYLILFFCYSIALLPLPARKALASLVAFFLGYIVRYRHGVIRRNLEHALPAMERRERSALQRRIYRHLGDQFLEVISQLHITRKNIARYCTVTNPEVLARYYAEGKNIVAVLGHHGNWELASIALSHFGPHQAVAIYKPLSSHISDRLFHKIRCRLGLQLVTMKDTMRHFTSKHERPHLTIFAGDQSPMKSEIQHWCRFLNQDTPVYLGAEKIARKYDIPVLFVEMIQVKRFCYKLTLHKVTDHPKEEPTFAITNHHTRMLEEAIMRQPELWLWSHKRWKHSPEHAHSQV
ncbi:MAG: lysophospholipid acyltransferase family protein [Flavobacteriales bacterium]|nr:lysophospholipid acyltransferase family protein [Flavobacteriales bacterium]MCB9449023.1 lysophospholipid acyltransferase family protein [Flavobacteriales bacterium]